MWEYFRYRHEKGSNRSVWPDANCPGTVSVRPCFILHPRHVLVGILTVTDSHDLDSRFVGLKFRRLPSVFNRGAVDCGVIKHPAAITNFLNIPLILQSGIGPGYRVLTQAVVILNPFAFMLANGSDVRSVQGILGHADPNITLKTYTSLVQQSEIKAVKGYEAFINAYIQRSEK